MKSIFIIFLIAIASTVFAEKLVTPNFEITITQNCEEGNVTCNNVSYDGVNRKNGKSIHLIGKTVHSLCADGLTPCAFQGYIFKNGNIEYFVSAAGELEVTQNKSKVVLSEIGEWKH